MNYSNVDLKDGYEASQNILDGLSFDTLLLEISCNIKDITKETVKAQFETDLKNLIQGARDIFTANLDNIVKEAVEQRNKQ